MEKKNYSCVDLDENQSIPRSFENEKFIQEYKKLFSDKDFNDAISFHTSTSSAFITRKEKIYNLIMEHLKR